MQFWAVIFSCFICSTSSLSQDAFGLGQKLMQPHKFDSFHKGSIELPVPAWNLIVSILIWLRNRWLCTLNWPFPHIQNELGPEYSGENKWEKLLSQNEFVGLVSFFMGLWWFSEGVFLCGLKCVNVFFILCILLLVVMRGQWLVYCRGKYVTGLPGSTFLAWILASINTKTIDKKLNSNWHFLFLLLH